MVESWKYEIRDKDSDRLIVEDTGFDSETDAEMQGVIAAEGFHIQNYCVRTLRVQSPA